jgi:hypothetical protein
MIQSQCDKHDLPVSRVQRDSVHLDKDIVVPHLGERNFLHLRLAYIDNLDGLHGLG